MVRTTRGGPEKDTQTGGAESWIITLIHEVGTSEPLNWGDDTQPQPLYMSL